MQLATLGASILLAYANPTPDISPPVPELFYRQPARPPIIANELTSIAGVFCIEHSSAVRFAEEKEEGEETPLAENLPCRYTTVIFTPIRLVESIGEWNVIKVRAINEQMWYLVTTLRFRE